MTRINTSTKRRGRALIVLAFLSCAWPLAATACLWDRDTPASEALGMPEVVAALTGRFPKNPPLYYEMRLERVSAELQSHPENLALYDDAGVACDRLGRSDQAIAWMEKKRRQLDQQQDSSPGAKHQRYRYHANLGTFLVHRWIRQGADRSRIAEVKAARDEIAAALQINPNAHYGREKYQLLALEWIINPPEPEPYQQYLPNLLGWSFHDIYGQDTEPQEADDAVRGLAGLVVLGNAWESVDIFHALNIALQRDSVGFERGRDGARNSLAYLAWLRSRELVEAGKGSLWPDAPVGEALKAKLAKPDFVKADALLDPAFQQLRAEAEAWQAARAAFMTKQLQAGRHPDTDPDFWREYTETPAPSLPPLSVPDAYKAWMTSRHRMALLVLLGVPAMVVGLIVTFWKIRSAKSRQEKAHLDSQFE